MKDLATLLADESRIDGRLRLELDTIARRLRSRELHARCAREWALVAVAGFALLAVGATFSPAKLVAIPVLLAAVAVVGFRLSRAWAKTRLDFAAAAVLVERIHPDLRQALRTALEQTPDTDGRYAFLQHRVIDGVLEHALQHRWRDPQDRRGTWAAGAHVAALAAVVAALGLAARSTPVSALAHFAAPSRGGVSVTPGNAEIERGSTVVVAARFERDLPRHATLVWTPAAGPTQRAPMARSLSDPVFALTLPAIAQDVDYRVEDDGGSTASFRLSVFDLPALVRADATLDYPDYTGLAEKKIADTRRISAVEGTRVSYEFLVNKPLARAALRAPDGKELALTPANPERTRFVADLTIAASQRYTLHLQDDAARANAAPPDIRIEALPNRRPELKFAFPRGDQRVSPLEEVHLQAGARDDFGLLDYGLGWSVGATDPTYLSLRQDTAPSIEAKFEKLLALEPTGVQPDALVTWFAWADDSGPDGKPRRTSSDVYFAEVRPFDETFREDANASGPPQGRQQSQGGQGDELLETQRQISIAIWKLRQQGAPTESFAEDVEALRGSQEQAKQQLEAAAARLRGDRERAAASEAAQFMDQSHDGLKAAGAEKSLDPLAGAWTGAQGAYQALLRMQPREYRVSQQRGGGGGQQRGSRNQRQLNQLQFRANDDRYETASEAQAMTTPEEREQLQTIAKLRDLARRQQDVNARMKELQTALQAARDEAEREQIQRELKRLEEEQRRMLADLDDVRQRLDQQASPGDTREARDQLEHTRDEMQRSNQSLRQGEVSQALASGTRAQEGLENARDDLRRESSSRFADQLREARQQARSLAERQAQADRDMQQLKEGGDRTLDDSARRQEIARSLEAQKDDLAKLTESLRRITEDSEESEPGLHRQLYDLLRQQGQGTAPDRLQTGAELLRRGFVDQARETQPEVAREFEQLRRGVERAAESVLGDEATTMRFAQRELEDLARQLQRERGDGENADGQNADAQARDGKLAADDTASDSQRNPGESGAPQRSNEQQNSGRAADRQQSNANPRGGEQPGDAQPGDRMASDESQRGQQGGLPQQQRGQGNRPAQDGTSLTGERSGALGGGGGRGGDDLSRALGELAGGWREFEGPITGGRFTEWTDRLRTIESLLEAPDARERLAAAREQAEELRREFRRHGKPPQWSLVEAGIAAPLADVRTWLRQELARRDDPASLQPVDRDPVPERYAEAVQRYYEALGR